MNIKSSEELDRIFDNGKEDMLPYFDTERARRPGLEIQPMQFECPSWMAEALDAEAMRQGVSRQSLIQQWLAEKLPHADK